MEDHFYPAVIKNPKLWCARLYLTLKTYTYKNKQIREN